MGGDGRRDRKKDRERKMLAVMKPRRPPSAFLKHLPLAGSLSTHPGGSTAHSSSYRTIGQEGGRKREGRREGGGS